MDILAIKIKIQLIDLYIKLTSKTMYYICLCKISGSIREKWSRLSQLHEEGLPGICAW